MLTEPCPRCDANAILRDEGAWWCPGCKLLFAVRDEDDYPEPDADPVKIATPDMIRAEIAKRSLTKPSAGRLAAMIRQAGYLRTDGSPWTPDQVRPLLPERLMAIAVED